MTEFVHVSSTVDTRDKAEAIAKQLLELRVAACVQIIGPIRSVYWWKSKIEQAEEWLCVAKGRESDYQKIEATIKSMHPYEVPEIIATPILEGNVDYLNWIRTETTPK